MACKTLKRIGNWESINQRPRKRQRLNLLENSTKPILWRSCEAKTIIFSNPLQKNENNEMTKVVKLNTEKMVVAEDPPITDPESKKAPFTFKEVQLIIQRRLQEREEELQEEFSKILNTMLAEQYDAFVRFTYDEIRNRFTARPSYLS